MPEQQYDLINQFLRGAINRRTFIRRAVGLGLAAPVVASTLAMLPRGAFAQDAALPAPSAPREDGTPAPDDQQVLKMVTPSPFRMDPPTYGGDLWQLQMMVFQALTRMTLDEEIGPGVADTWESNADATVWTFHLNPNAKFSDGTPITADDVIWTWSWIGNPASKSTSPDTFKWVVGYDEVKSGAAELIVGHEGDRRQHARDHDIHPLSRHAGACFRLPGLRPEEGQRSQRRRGMVARPDHLRHLQGDGVHPGRSGDDDARAQ